MSKQIRIFISSTWLDLQSERQAVEEALQRMQASFAGMEYFGSRPETPRDVSLAEVNRCDVYIGIFAHRYGSGITEAEYRRAQERNLPCFIYLKDENVPVLPSFIESDRDEAAKLKALKSDLKARHTISYFKSPDNLATEVLADLHKHLTRELTHSEEASSRQGDGYPKKQSIVPHGEVQSTQRFGMPIQPGWSELDSRRLEDLKDNVRQNRELLKAYEDELLVATDLRDQARYRREIARLKSSTEAYQKEYNELLGKMTTEPSQSVKDMGNQLQEMDTKQDALLTKLDTLLAGQATMQNDLSDLRIAVLSRFDTTERTIISTIVERLDQGQLVMTQEVLDAIKAGQVPEDELREVLTSVQQVLAEIRQRGNELPDSTLNSIAERLSEVIEEPKLDVNHKLKLTIPIIPLLLSYEGEVGLRRETHLKNVWKNLLAIVRG